MTPSPNHIDQYAREIVDGSSTRIHSPYHMVLVERVVELLARVAELDKILRVSVETNSKLIEQIADQRGEGVSGGEAQS